MTLLVKAAWHFDAAPQVLVEVDSADGPAVIGLMDLHRVHPDGSQYRVITDGPAVLNGNWSGFDYHAPFNLPVSYVASAAGQTSDPSPAAIMNSDVAWLIHPARPTLSMQVEIMAPQKEVSYKDRTQQFEILNRRLPVVIGDYPRGGERGEISVRVTRANRALIKALLADGGPILLNAPWGEQDFGWKWIQPGDISIENIAGFVQFPTRNVTIPYTECDQPDVNAISPWTYADVLAEFPSYATVKAGFTNYLNARLRIRGG